MNDLQKNILITGAASGLGKPIAKIYANKGWNILVVDIQDQLGSQFVIVYLLL